MFKDLTMPIDFHFFLELQWCGLFQSAAPLLRPAQWRGRDGWSGSSDLCQSGLTAMVERKGMKKN